MHLDRDNKHRSTRALLLVWALAFALAYTTYWFVLPQGKPIACTIVIGVLAALLWITEILPLAVTALLIPVGLYAVGLFGVADVFNTFGNPVLFLILGGYSLAAAIHVNRIDHWIARRILERAGTHSLHVFFALMFTSAVLSMFISNTATAALLLPVVAGILSGQDDDPNLARLLILSIAYGASIGGVATLIGSPPNAIAAGLLEINFLHWLSYGLPVSIAMLVFALPFLWWTNTPRQQHIYIEFDEPRPLSPIGKRTIAILGIVLILWLLGPIITQMIGLPKVIFSAASVACMAMASLILTRCITWKELKHNVRWSVLLLLGGGLSLGHGLTESGAAKWLAESLVTYIENLPAIGLLGILVTIAVFATELISNTAVTATMAPILIGVALQLGLGSESLVVPVAIASSMAFMLPVATPPNAIVHASGFVTQRDMIRVGFWLNLIAIGVISSLFYIRGL